MSCFISIEGEDPIRVLSVTHGVAAFLRMASSIPLDTNVSAFPGACYVATEINWPVVMQTAAKRSGQIRLSLSRDRWVLAANWSMPPVDKALPVADTRQLQKLLTDCQPDFQLWLDRAPDAARTVVPPSRRGVLSLGDLRPDLAVLRTVNALRDRLPLLPRQTPFADERTLADIAPEPAGATAAAPDASKWYAVPGLPQHVAACWGGVSEQELLLVNYADRHKTAC